MIGFMLDTGTRFPQSRGLTRFARRARGIAGGLLIFAVLAGGLIVPPNVWSADSQDGPAAEIRMRLNQAKKLGAKGQLPMAYWDLDDRLDDAEKNGASEAEWSALKTDVLRLLKSAEFVAQMRQQKSGIEALLGRFDQALAEIAELYDIEQDPVLSGSESAKDLIVKLGEANLHRQVKLDSMMVVNRRLSEIASGQTAGQDSLITSLQVEVSALRRELWETQLRAGVAEADRSAAETVLSAKQQREAAIAALRSTFDPEEAEILLTPAGGAILRVFGFAFAVGSSEIQAGHSALLGKVAEVIQVFPEAPLRVEGHTDNTGSRQANLRLSRRRAEAVARLLEQKMGLAEGAIASDGFGPDRPLALNDTPEGRKRNRRIDVVLDVQQ